MIAERFIVVGENIHCTRTFKTDGSFIKTMPDGRPAISYKAGKEPRLLPVPDAFLSGADWKAGKVKHCAVAIWQANYGKEPDRSAGQNYIETLARKQEAIGSSYLDINVDEFSTDPEERSKMMQWTVKTVQQAVSIPVSVDSSNTSILKAGLAVADKKRAKAMVNSVSLERLDAVDVAEQFGAVVIASAAGEAGLPSSNEERIANLDNLMPKLEKAGLKRSDIHIDPLVLPISTDSNNGRLFLEAVTMVRQKYGPEIHIVAGLSNVSFGMPERKLINQVFACLAADAGADGGIVDPIQINGDILENLDRLSEPFQLAKALLMGTDEFGMNFIAASREGKLK